MPVGDRALVQEVVELGIETVAGTAVPSTIKLSGLQVDLGTQLELDRIAPMGNLWDTIAAPRQEWGVGSVSGFPTYPELAYVFSNVFGAAVVATPTGGTTTRRYSWAPSSSVPWTPRTWTIRRGMVGNSAESAAYGLMSGVNMSFSRTATPTIGGDLFSYALDYSASVGSTGVAALSVVPVLPAQVCVYLDPTAAAIGTTRLTRDFMASFDVGGLFAPFWPLDCTLNSFAGAVPQKPSAEAKLQLGNDAAGRALLANMRAGSTVYVRIEATGPIIETTLAHRLRIDLALKVASAPSRGDADGLSTLEWTFGIFDDPSFGGAMRVELTTNVPSV